MPRSSLRSFAAVLTVVLTGATLAAVGPGAVAGASAGKRAAALRQAKAAKPGRCDPLGGPRCLLPFPNDFFTVADRHTDTKRRVHLSRASMPINKDGVRVDPREQNRNDGFSPGSAMVALIPGLDLARTKAAPVTDMAASLAKDAPIVLLDADTGKRFPYWAERDAQATDDATRLLFVRPARNLTEGHRYVIGLRDLKAVDGKAIAATGAFRYLRDKLPSKSRIVERRRPAMERIFKDLGKAGVKRRGLVLAWDFTVASGRNLSERLLSMRDQSFKTLGKKAPTFTVDSMTEAPSGPVLRTITGTFEAPRYLTGKGETGSVLNNDASPDGIPKRNGTQKVPFTCLVPRSAVGPDGKAVPSSMALYGHGLLGSQAEVQGAGPRFMAASNTTFCAINWIGMSSEDVPTAVDILKDLSKFRTLADRLQQSILNFLYLGRLLKHPDGFATAPAFKTAGGEALIDRRYLTFVGLSQGGIIGGAASAVAQDWRRAVLGVPGMNYSTLLNRSIDFDTYGAILNPAYPDEVDRQLGLLLVQMLWDRGENDGYAQHLTSKPYAHTPAKQVLLFEAFGDHQVANVTTEVMARTIGAKVRAPALAPGRSPDKTPLWDIDKVTSLPARDGSYLVLWDFGTPAPPPGNEANRGGKDPHGAGSRVPAVLEMNTRFLEQGELVDVCSASPCQTPGG